MPGRSIVVNRTCALSSKSSPKCMLFPVAAPAMNSTGSPVAGPNDLPANTRPALEETTHSGEVCMFLPYVLCMTSSHQLGFRSEERRVGKECRSRWRTYNEYTR